MTVVSIKCHECDEVKAKEEVEIRGDGNICSDCKTDVPAEVEERSEADDGESSEEPADRDTESEENDASAEGDKKPLEESFSEQDPLDW